MMGYGRKSSIRFNYLDSFPLRPNRKKSTTAMTNAPAPSGGVAKVSGARCAERANEADARGRTDKTAGV